ncbi:MAG: DNA mismatch repair protein MutL [Pseudohongiellaceae bacterium]|jgi:DNA mismatch repair protein MutL
MIQSLPQAVIDRIAAGEVVERPAAVVKELIENALDAGARQLDVVIEGGGLQLIRVADDGAGISSADLPLAFGSHATSKLSDVDDLYHIASFGFRGEALSSIAAVSRCRLTSSTSSDGAGVRIDCVAGELGPATPAASPKGTVVEVRDLFFNTPARRAFLGATSTEAAKCREVCSSLSLVNPGVRWKITVDGRLRFSSDGASELPQRIEAVYGRDLASQMILVSGADEGLAVQGMMTLPAAAKPRPRAQQLFVNGRLIKDRGVLAAVRIGCKDFLPGSLQPAWVLQLTVDPLRLDVNVHPTKAEVRFRDKDSVFRLVRRACRQALLAADLAPRVRAEHLALEPSPETALPPGQGLSAWPKSENPSANPGPHHGSHTSSQPGRSTDRREWQRQGAPTSGPTSAGQPSSRSLELPLAGTVSERGPDSPKGQSLLLGDVRPAARYLQVLNTYIIYDSPEGLVLVDQHALHERILYADLQAQLARGEMTRQRLLIPETVQLSPSAYDAALLLADELQNMGLELAPFGNDTLAISAVPAVLRNENLSDLLQALIDPPDVHGDLPHGLDRRLFTMACHAAVKAGDPLGEGEITAMLEQGRLLEHDSTCPHGRPTRLLIDRTELERLFKRSGF